MTGNRRLTRASLRTPRAAAVAGILFSLSVFAAFWLLRTSVPADPTEPGAWLNTSSRTVALALNLIPFSGVAFLWFIGVLRDRLDEREDRFFATVFLGSGLLFLGMLFVAAGVIGAIISAFAATPNELIDSPAFHLARAVAYNIANVYMLKMAAVFMISLSTVTWLTATVPRWLTFSWLYAGFVSSVWRELFRLGVFDVPTVGSHGQRLYSDRKLYSRAQAIPIGSCGSNQLAWARSGRDQGIFDLLQNRDFHRLRKWL
jgi:hypothetical protein